MHKGKILLKWIRFEKGGRGSNLFYIWEILDLNSRNSDRRFFYTRLNLISLATFKIFFWTYIKDRVKIIFTFLYYLVNSIYLLNITK